MLEPPDSIPNSVVKRYIADGSVGLPHVRVGHRQASNLKPDTSYRVFLHYYLLVLLKQMKKFIILVTAVRLSKI